MHGNVWEWTEDCWNDSNQGNPANGNARTTGDCSRGVVRGGSWGDDPQFLRSVVRSWFATGFRGNIVGFRLARTLIP
jgi:formylglycine-generating enzyme required for sulfatase activity